MKSILIGFFVILAVLAVGLLYIFNHLVRLRQNVRESWSAIDTELKRRYDLIPNLVESVKGYAGHEKQTLEAVTQARAAAVANQGSPTAQASTENALSGALQNLLVVAERYPELKASENFNTLMQELSETETRISQARRFYNANVREMNTAVQSFPSSLVAGRFGYTQEPYFETAAPEREAVAVKI